MPFAQCAAATAAGHQCTNLVPPTRDLCRIHLRVINVRIFDRQGQPPPQQCHNCRLPATVGEYCARHDELRPRPDLPPAERCVHRGCMRAIRGEHHRCRRHTAVFMFRQQRMVEDELYATGMIMMVEMPNAWPVIVEGWRARIGQPFITRTIVERLEVQLARDFRIPELWNQYLGDHAPMNEHGHVEWPMAGRRHAQPPRGELDAFVRDGQNVHTRVVTEQTNSALQILLNADVASDQKTLAESHCAYMTHIALDRIKSSLTEISSVDRDVKRWYRTPSCRADGDYLYKRVLDGLWAKIKVSPVRQELEIRLWQEMLDSVGMCCDGHISRLTNVLSGFDDAFAPELSPAEKLQNRMAVISAMEGGIILQTAEALAAFKEFGVPRDQWEAWIDAL